VPAAAIAANLVKNLLAPVRHRLDSGAGCYGMDGDLDAVPVTLDWLASAAPGVVAVEGLNVLELGPGRTPEMLAALLLLGAREATGVDLELRTQPSIDAQRLAVLADRLSGVAPAFGTTSQAISQRADSLAAALPLRLEAYDGMNVPLPPAAVDLVVSKSVLEHVRQGQIRPLLASLRRVLRSGGSMLHVIDLRDHLHIEGDEKQTGDWLEFLRYPEGLYEAMFSRRSSYSNRLRASEWRREFEVAGFEVTGWREGSLALPAQLDRSRLQARWAGLEDAQLAVGHVAVAAVSP
jgi:SAM-dependent methyltransferase